MSAALLSPVPVFSSILCIHISLLLQRLHSHQCHRISSIRLCTSFSSAWIIANTLQSYFTSTPLTVLSPMPSYPLHTLVHFILQYLYSRQYPRIYAMRPSGENRRPSQLRQHLLDQGIAPFGWKKGGKSRWIFHDLRADRLCGRLIFDKNYESDLPQLWL